MPTVPELVEAARADLVAIYERDPACHRLLQPILYFKGYQACRPIAWGIIFGRRDSQDLAYFVQMRVSARFSASIFIPAAMIGKGIMIDHAHSIVIGETAVVGDNVSMLHSVTLGGTGKEEEDRHPENWGRRADRGRGQGAGQHQGRTLQPHRSRLGGAGGCAAVQDGRRYSGADCRRGGLRSAVGSR